MKKNDLHTCCATLRRRVLRLTAVMAFCLVCVGTAYAQKLQLELRNVCKDGELFENHLSLKRNSTLPVYDNKDNYRFVIYRTYALGMGAEEALFIAYPYKEEIQGNQRIISFYVEGYEWLDGTEESRNDNGDCVALEKSYFKEHPPVLVMNKNTGEVIESFDLVDYFKKGSYVYNAVVYDRYNSANDHGADYGGGAYGYRMEMNKIAFSNWSSTTYNGTTSGGYQAYNYNGGSQLGNMSYADYTGYYDINSNVVCMKLITPTISTNGYVDDRVGSSRTACLSPIYKKKDVDGDTERTLSVAQDPSLEITATLHRSAETTINDRYGTHSWLYPFMQNPSYTIVSDDIVKTTVSINTDQSVSISSEDFTRKITKSIQWLQLLQQRGLLSTGLRVNVETTAKNANGDVNKYTESTWLDGPYALVTLEDHLGSKASWSGTTGSWRGYSAKIKAQSNWDGSRKEPRGSSMEETYKWRVWRVTESKTTLLDFDNLEGKDFGAEYEENEAGDGFTLTDFFLDKDLTNGSKTVKYIIRYYTSRYNVGTELPASYYPMPTLQVLTTDIERPATAPTLVPAAAMPSQKISLKDDDDEDVIPPGYSEWGYCVGEQTLEVTYTPDILTGIEDLRPDAGLVVENVHYYNLAGVESDKPFSGVNIVVYRMKDGTQQVEKCVF